jgi:hypothetical protein
MSPQKELADQLFPGLIQYIELLPLVTDIRFYPRQAANATVIDSWESTNSLKLPESIRSILTITNGFELSWFAKYGDVSIKIGTISLNAIEDFVVSMDIVHESLENYIIHCEIESSSFGKTLITFPNKSPQEIWFKSKDCNFKICDDYKNYFRVMVSFLGIAGWQLGYCELDWSNDTQNWINFYVPKIAKELRNFNAKLKGNLKFNGVKNDCGMKKKCWDRFGIPSDTQNWWIAEQAYKKNGNKNLFNLDCCMKQINAIIFTKPVSRPTSAFSKRTSRPSTANLKS